MKPDKETRRLDLGTAPIGYLLLRMSLPSIVAMLIMALYNVVDTFWIGKISPEAIAALTICFPIQMLFGAIGVGTGIGAGSFTARMFGAGEVTKANRVAGQIIFLAALFGIMTIVLGGSGAETTLRFFGATELILPLSKGYFGFIVFGAPFLFFMMMSDFLFRAEGNPNMPMFVITTSALLNAVLDPFLIFGWGPFPEMGVRGAGLATAIAQFSTSFLSLYFLLSRRSGYRIHPGDLIPRWSIIVSIYHVGIPTLITHIALSAVLILYNHRLAGFGHLAVASLGLGFRINGVLMMILFGIGDGVMPITGFNYGARTYDRIGEVKRVATIASTVIGGAATLLIELWARPLLMIFTTDSELLAIAVPALRIFVATQFLIGPVVTSINIFTGLGKGVTSMILLVGHQLLFVAPLIYVLPLWCGLRGVWMAQPISNIISFAIISFWATRVLHGLKER